jgi:hypothetical protein
VNTAMSRSDETKEEVFTIGKRHANARDRRAYEKTNDGVEEGDSLISPRWKSEYENTKRRR